MVHLWVISAFVWLSILHTSSAITVDVNDANSVKKAASTVASGMVSYYQNTAGVIFSGVPGYLPGPDYFWWECGSMFGALIDYWKYTGDPQYNDMVADGMQWQTGPNNDFMPQNASKWMGNDDQGFWALSAMSAAETNFQDPKAGRPSWLSLAQAVFNEQSGRWDDSNCGGGMRWQALPVLAGWNLKNSISNGIYFQLGARLARFTGNETYAVLAERTFVWMEATGLIDKRWNVFDNSEADKLNCTQLDHHQWSYNAATMMVGAAYMYNFTNGSAAWEKRLTGLVNRTSVVMFPINNTMVEICEPSNDCNTDQKSFKAYLARWLAATTQMAPYTYEKIIAMLKYNAAAAAAQCTGSSTLTAAGLNIGTACGLKWYNNGTWDGSDGVGQQMAALEVLLGTLIQDTDPPLTADSGGTSVSEPGAGSGSSALSDFQHLPIATHADRVGAGIVTAAILVIGIAAMVFMFSDAWEYRDRLNAALAASRPTAKSTRNQKGKWSEKKRSVVVLGALDEKGESVKSPVTTSQPAAWGSGGLYDVEASSSGSDIPNTSSIFGGGHSRYGNVPITNPTQSQKPGRTENHDDGFSSLTEVSRDSEVDSAFPTALKPTPSPIGAAYTSYSQDQRPQTSNTERIMSWQRGDDMTEAETRPQTRG